MQDKWRKVEHCMERAEISTGWRSWSMQDKWRKVEHCIEKMEQTIFQVSLEWRTGGGVEGTV